MHFGSSASKPGDGYILSDTLKPCTKLSCGVLLLDEQVNQNFRSVHPRRTYVCVPCLGMDITHRKFQPFMVLLPLVFGAILFCSVNVESSTPLVGAPNLKPDYPTNVVSNNGGKLGVWDGRASDLAAMKVSLAGNSIMQPAHFDCDILAHVVSGAAKWGLVYANGQWAETTGLEQGDSFVIPRETVVWFYNDDVSDGSEEFAFVGFAQTSGALKPGVITALPIVGSGSMYLGFDERNLGDAWALDKGTTKRLIHQQKESLFLKLTDKLYLSSPEASKVQGTFSFKTRESQPDVYIPGGGKQWTVVGSKDADHAGLSSLNLGGELILQRPNSLYGPAYYSNADTLIYVMKGRGHIWIVEPMKNQQILDMAFFEGQVLSIPRSHGFLITADSEEDLEHFQAIEDLLRWKALPYLAIPWEILRASFAVDDSMLDKVLHSRTWEYTLLPPTKGLSIVSTFNKKVREADTVKLKKVMVLEVRL